MTLTIKNILVATADKEERKGLIEFLSDSDFNTTGVSDGATAIGAALKESPGIIVIDFDIPVIEAEKVYRILRNNPNTKDVSFIFLVTAMVDIKEFRTDADSLLFKPLKLEELRGTIKKQVLRLKKIKGPLGDREKEIEGKLTHLSLPDLLQMVEINKKEGVIKISNNDQRGVIYVKDGEIYNATMGKVEKEKALFRLLAWREGSFEFLPRVITTVSRKIVNSTGNLLMEGARQSDEYNKSAKLFPPADSFLKLKADLSSLPKGLKSSYYEVLSLVEYYPKVSDLVDACSLTDFEVCQTLLKMINKGLVEVLKEEQALKGTPLIDLLRSPKAIRIREKMIDRWPDMASFNYGKLLIASTGGKLIPHFLGNCKALPSFSINPHLLTKKVYQENPFGVLGEMNLYGGMDLLLYALPTSDGMTPLWSAFSKNGIGLLLLWDEGGAGRLGELREIKESFLAYRSVPVMHVYFGKEAPGKENGSRNALAIKEGEEIFSLDVGEPDKVHNLFYSYFGQFMKDDNSKEQGGV